MRLTPRILRMCFVFAFITGCATAKFAQTGQTYPPYDGPVKVLSAPPQGVKYVEIGIVSSAGGMIHQCADLIEALQKEAAKKGANAIIVGGVGESTHAMVTYSPTFGLQGGTFPQKNMMAVAIRILE